MVVIIGAGITGLVLAHELARRGEPFVVLEARSEPGGVIRTVQVGGRLYEVGPQRTRLVPPVRALVRELCLEDELLTAPEGLPLLVYRSGRLREVPFSIGAAIRTDLIGLPGKLRILFEPLTGGERRDETVGDFLIRKFGREAYEAMLGPLYGGLYASDPKDMLMRWTLSQALATFGVEGSILVSLARRAMGGRREPVPACSFRSGMRALPDTLYRAHADRVRLGTAARALRRDGGRYVVETDAGDVVGDDVVLTVPADAAAALLGGLAPDASDRLARLTYNPLAVVYLDAEVDRPAMGYQVAFGERLETRGVTFNAHLFGRPGVYTAYLGGAKNPRLVDLPDDRLGDLAAAEFETVTGRPARPMHVERVRMPAWDRSWTALEGLELPAGIHVAANWESRAGVPGRIARAQALARELA